MYCKCKEPKTVDVIISHKKHQVCSKRLGGCGEEYKPKVFTGAKAKIMIDGVEIGFAENVGYSFGDAIKAYDKAFVDNQEEDFFNFDQEFTD